MELSAGLSWTRFLIIFTFLSLHFFYLHAFFYQIWFYITTSFQTISGNTQRKTATIFAQRSVLLCISSYFLRSFLSTSYLECGEMRFQKKSAATLQPVYTFFFELLDYLETLREGRFLAFIFTFIVARLLGSVPFPSWNMCSIKFILVFSFGLLLSVGVVVVETLE